MFGVLVVAAVLALGACSGDDGKDGDAGPAGPPGANGGTGGAGLSCWDLNANGLADIDSEDVNKDGNVDVYDCRTTSGAYDTVGLHKGYFTENAYTGTQQCLNCHGKAGDDVMTTAHWKWEGVASNIAGHEGETHGKKDLINNFCQAIPSNEGRCTQCHIGIGWKDKTFDFGNPKNIDCLACHDQTGTYKKAPTTAGAPDPSVDLAKVAQSVANNAGVPPRATCVFCHASAGGDDNVKHGDIANNLKATTREYDVHLGTDGGNFTCVECHQVKKSASGETLSHGIGGLAFHSVDEGVMKACTDCHGAAAGVHAGTTVENIVRTHTTLACQVCHIPAIARKTSTMTDWRWSQAGLDAAPASCTPADPAVLPARATYSKMKGCFVWENNVRPTLRYYDGKWNRMMFNVNDHYASLPVDLASPTADYRTPGAMIYPFKKMTGNQPADKNNKTVLVPHLFGTAGGPNPYWGKYDWNLSLIDGAAYTGQVYTGTAEVAAYEFVDTVMLLKVDHEVAPKERAYGMDNHCQDCHFGDQIDWSALGWTGDPADTNTPRRPVLN
jgi:octaheme c-type cytochrome (tetrathionate reductase family)